MFSAEIYLVKTSTRIIKYKSWVNKSNLATKSLYQQEPWSNLEEKVNSSILKLKDDFSSRTSPSIFTSIAPVLLDWSNKTTLTEKTIHGKYSLSIYTLSILYLHFRSLKYIIKYALSELPKKKYKWSIKIEKNKKLLCLYINNALFILLDFFWNEVYFKIIDLRNLLQIFLSLHINS